MKKIFERLKFRNIVKDTKKAMKDRNDWIEDFRKEANKHNKEDNIGFNGVSCDPYTVYQINVLNDKIEELEKEIKKPRRGRK
jgi:wobble nucleotide-excising tRNase